MLSFHIMKHSFHASYVLAARSLSVFMYNRSVWQAFLGQPVLQVFFRAKYANVRAKRSEEDWFFRLFISDTRHAHTCLSMCWGGAKRENTLSARVMS